MKQIALIKAGTTIEQIRDQDGDYEDWFSEGLGLSGLLQIDVYRHQQLPDPDHLGGIIVTGSPSMVSHREGWSENTAQWLAGAVDKNVPILGVCYGHQLLAHALGGKVGPNPAGRQIGTVQTRLLEPALQDPLLGALPRCFMSQSSHSEVVLELPPNARRLATSPLDNNFAIRFSENAWGVQFHPEFSAPVTMKYIQYRMDAIRSEGLSPEQLSKNVIDTPEAKTVLTAFAGLMRDSIRRPDRQTQP